MFRDRTNSNYLFNYRITPHSTTGQSPAELMLGRQPRSCLDLLKPDLERTVSKKQEIQKRTHDKTVSNRNFCEGEAVYARNYSSGGSPWLADQVVKQTGPVSVEVELQDGSLVWRHFDQLRHRVRSTSVPLKRAVITDNPVSDDYLFLSVPSPDQTNPSVSTDHPREQITSSSKPVLPRRNPPRNCGPPDRLRF